MDKLQEKNLETNNMTGRTASFSQLFDPVKPAGDDPKTNRTDSNRHSVNDVEMAERACS